MRDLVREQLDAVIGEAAGLAHAQTARLRDLRELLQQHNFTGPAEVAGGLAAQAEELVDRLAHLDSDQVLEAARGAAARRGPWAFAAGGAAVGVLVWDRLRRAAGPERPPAGALDEGGDDEPRRA